MEIGFVGLGRMGHDMVRRLLAAGIGVVVYDLQAAAVEAVVQEGAKGASSPRELARALAAPRIVWLMVPAGSAVEDAIWGAEGLVESMEAGDVIIDGGNSHYHHSQTRAEILLRQGIGFLDVGTSGGIEGARGGLSLTVGGKPENFAKCQPVLTALSAEDGFSYVGPSGSGHYTKMVHNAIEYGILQILGEGLWLLEKSDLSIDLGEAIRAWSHGSIVQSRLVEMCGRVFARRGEFDAIAPEIGGGSTGQWAIDEANHRGVPMPLITMAYIERLASRQKESFAAKVVAALRQEFGGHEVKRKEKPAAGGSNQ